MTQDVLFEYLNIVLVKRLDNRVEDGIINAMIVLLNDLISRWKMVQEGI